MTPVFRLALSAAWCAAICVVLVRAARNHGGAAARWIGPLRSAALAAGVLFAASFWITAAARLFYPWETTWLGGAVLDMGRRLLEHHPLYAAPSAEWVPLPLPPLMPALGAAVMGVAGASPVALRLISIGSAATATAVLALHVRGLVAEPDPPAGEDARRRIARPWPPTAWALCAALPVAVTAGACGLLPDAEYPGMLMLALVVSGGALLARSLRSLPPRAAAGSPSPVQAGVLALAAGTLFAAAALALQAAVVFAAAALAAAAWRRAWPQALLCALAFAVVLADGWWAGNAVSHGGFGWYLVHVALHQPWVPHVHEAITALAAFSPALLLLAVEATAGRRLIGAEPPEDLVDADEAPAFRHGPDLLLPMGLAGAAGGLFWPELPGAGAPALLAGCLFLAAAAVVRAARWERRDSNVRGVAAMLAFGLLALGVGGVFTVQTYAGLAAGRRYTEVVRALETQGPVLCLDHGGFSREPHPHRAALEALVRAEGGMPPAIARGLAREPYVAVLTDGAIQPRGPVDAAIFGAYEPGEGPEIGGAWVLSPPYTPRPFERAWAFRPVRPVRAVRPPAP